MSVFGRAGSLAAVVADDLVNLYDDVLGDVGFYRSAIDHLGEVDALLVWLSDRWRNRSMPTQFRTSESTHSVMKMT